MAFLPERSFHMDYYVINGRRHGGGTSVYRVKGIPLLYDSMTVYRTIMGGFYIFIVIFQPITVQSHLPPKRYPGAWYLVCPKIRNTYEITQGKRSDMRMCNYLPTKIQVSYGGSYRNERRTQNQGKKLLKFQMVPCVKYKV